MGQIRVVPGPQSRTPIPEEKGGDHVNISSECDALPKDAAAGPWAGNEMWRNAPRSTMTIQVLGAVLLVGLGLLLGSSWTIQAGQLKLRQQAQERRRLNDEWSAVRQARQQRGGCPRCGSPLSEQDWYFAPTLMNERPIQSPGSWQ